MNHVPRPLELTDATVTFDRADWEDFLDRMEDAEDRADIAAVEARRAEIGDAAHRRHAYTMDEAERILNGVHPLVIWRERAGLRQRQLAALAETSPGYLAEIEGGKKPGSAATLARIAKVLDVPMELLVRE